VSASTRPGGSRPRNSTPTRWTIRAISSSSSSTGSDRRRWRRS
jgi:hypothetical protein